MVQTEQSAEDGVTSAGNGDVVAEVGEVKATEEGTEDYASAEGILKFSSWTYSYIYN